MSYWEPEFLRNLVDISEFSDIPFAGQREQLEPSNGNNGQDYSHLGVISEHFDQNLDMTEQSERNETNPLSSFGNENKNYNCDSIPSFAGQREQLELSNGNNGQDSSHLGVISEHYDQNLDMTEQSERNEANPLSSFGNENKNYNCDSIPTHPSAEQGKQMEVSSVHYDQTEQPEKNENKSFSDKTWETEDRNYESDTLQSPPSSEKIDDQVIETLKAIQNDAGATLLQIKKYLSSNRNVDVASMDNDIKEFIGSAVSDGVLVKTDRFRYFLASEGVPQMKTRKRKRAQAITYPKRRRN